ncbi:MAG TPA: class I tRNA ligase family protein, partial [Syntrophobacteria bacterium]|nr:class I tRNA ligase family protein [Syntrophobacteria bacterium]
WRLVYEEREQLGSVEPYRGDGSLDGQARALHRKVHQTINKVTEDIEQRFHFNTAISAVMELVNAIYQVRSEGGYGPDALPVLRLAIETAVVLISPIVPHIADEMWQAMGHRQSLIKEPWPRWDEEAAAEEKLLIVVQVNGRLRSRVFVSPDASHGEIEQAALADERIRAFLSDRPPRNVVVVAGRLVNVVV